MEVANFPDEGTEVLVSYGTHPKSQSELWEQRMQDEQENISRLFLDFLGCRLLLQM
jgi:hypothetical protein